jgi:osmotically-inducible protein OsmY
MMIDSELAARIRAELALEPGISIDEVRIEVEDGIVTLQGQVADRAALHFAESCVMRVEGARAVINELSIRTTHS